IIVVSNICIIYRRVRYNPKKFGDVKGYYHN
ncbi:prolipoprotein diacylglyceryl transferase, partial [Mammaliicoccus sciuri]